MALAAETKHRILFLLGYSGKTLIQGSTHYHSIVDSRLKNLNVHIEDQVEVLLREINVVRDNLRKTQVKGNIQKLGDIEMDTSRGRSFILKEYMRLISELSSLLDIPVKNKPSGNIRVTGP
jgi:hypothetical protein